MPVQPSRARIIWQYQIPLVSSFEIELPIGHRVLHIAEVGGAGLLWVYVNPSEEREHVRFLLIGSEQEFDSALVGEYVGTFHLSESRATVHVFESPISTRVLQ